MKNYITLFITGLVLVLAGADVALAADGEAGSGLAALGAAIAMGVAALGGTLSQGKAISSALDSIGRNPSASSKMFTPMIIGLVLIESLVIISFVIANKLAG